MLNKFCFCVSLRRGVLVFGVVSAVVSFALTILYALVVAKSTADPFAWFHITYLSISTADFLTTLPLIYGCVKSKRFFLFPWIVFNLIFLLIVTIGSIVLTFVNYIVASMLILCGFFWYFWVCVISLYKEMGMNNGRGRVIVINSIQTETRFRL